MVLKCSPPHLLLTLSWRMLPPSSPRAHSFEQSPPDTPLNLALVLTYVATQPIQPSTKNTCYPDKKQKDNQPEPHKQPSIKGG